MTFMKVDQAGLNFLEDVEGLELVAYLDTGGVPTIGIGSTRMFNKPVQLGMKCTKEQAYEQCAKDLGKIESLFHNIVKIPLNQNQVNALASFVYNVGEEAFKKSTMLRKLNTDDIVGAAEQFDRWVFDGGKKVAGLINRRRKEKELFLAV